MKGLLFTEKQVEGLFSSFSCRIQWVSWLVKLEGELDTAVFFAFFVKLVLAIAAAEMDQLTRFSLDVESGIWFDLRQINFNSKKFLVWVVCYQQIFPFLNTLNFSLLKSQLVQITCIYLYCIIFHK